MQTHVALTVLHHFATLFTEEDSDDEFEVDGDLEDIDDDSLPPGNSTRASGASKKSKFSGGVKFSATSQAGLELVRSEEETWLPLFIVNICQAENVAWHVVLAVIVPSGVGFVTSKDIEMHLEKGGTELVIVVTWPAWFVELLFLGLFSEVERASEDFVLVKQALKQRMAEMRPTKDCPLKSVARIPLPFEVQPHIADENWRFLGEKVSGTRVLCVDLKEPKSGAYEGKKIKPCTTENETK